MSIVQEWTSLLLTIFAVALLAGSPICGWWADQTSARQTPFLVGLLLLGGSTLLFALAKTLALLIVARILQGLSGAIVWTVALAMLADRVGTAEIGAHFGTVVAARSIATVAGPLIGGIVYARAGYYMVYITAFIFLGVDVVLRLVMIEAKVARRWDPSIGGLGGQKEAGAATMEKDESVERGNADSTSTPNEPHRSDAQPAKGRLYRFSQHLPPFITMLSSIRLVMALYGCAALAIMLGSFEATVPLFVNSTFNWDSMGAGLVFLAIIIPTFISPLIGWLADKHGTRWYVVAGYILTMVPIILLRVVTQNTMHDKIVFCVLLAFCGAFAMLFEIPVQIEIVMSVEEKMKENPRHYGAEKGAYAQAFAWGNLMYALGLIVGPLWGGYMVEGKGWGVFTLALGVWCGASAVPAAIWTEGSIFKKIAKGKVDQAEGGGQEDVPAPLTPVVERRGECGPAWDQKEDTDRISISPSAL
ncbi:hypothetical protein FQN53_007562 [Emmonsiellopsis sp. PD_33]|nr:hypothetical protein FQN53_007562 [Emmonsiellopsis sp. PD_33]